MADSPEVAKPAVGTPSLPDRHVLLRHTDWTALTHAYGRADDIPAALSQLTDEDPATRAKALQYLERVNHQNSVYSATAPAAMYLAAILNDPWTVPPINAFYPTRRPQYRGLRAALLDWLGDIAYDVGDDTGRIAAKHGFPMDDLPDVIALRSTRPGIHGTVVPFLSDDDIDVRQSALIAAAQLLDAPELITHRAGLITPLRDTLATCPDTFHRGRAKRTLIAWGEDPTTFLEFTDTATDTIDTTQRWAPDPPFG